jgi:thiol-disulfide isomerase/thioredoxin
MKGGAMKTMLSWMRTLALLLALPVVSPAQSATPGNDLFQDRIRLVGPTAASTGSNAGATREAAEPWHNGSPAGHSVWWSWEAQEKGFLTVATEGSSFDTVLALYTGDALPSLVEVAYDDDGGENYTSRVVLRVEAGRTYQIAVDGFESGGEAESGSVRLHLAFASQLSAPAWSLNDVDGKAVSSTNYAGQVVLLNFWATWCGPCVAEMPGMVQLQDRYRQQGFSIVGISVDEGGPTVVRPFVIRQRLNYQIVMSNGRVENDFGGIEFIPTSFLIDREGNLVDKLIGFTSESDFEAKIRPLLTPLHAPRANFQTRDGKLVVSWPGDEPGVAIESSESVTGPWVLSPISGVATNGQFEAEFPTSQGRAFFRLRR